MSNPNHVTDHNDMRTVLVDHLARFGLGNTLGGPWDAGDPDHIGRHNAMVDALNALATTAGQTFTIPLPPHRNLGDSGHIADHHAIESALIDAMLWPAWNAATGGTVTEVDNYNGTTERWRVHDFKAGGTLTVSQGTQPFRVLVVGAGGNGTTTGYYSRTGYGASGGLIVSNDAMTLSPGAHAVTIGPSGDAASTLGAITSASGIRHGGGGNSIACCNTNGWPGGDGLNTNIRGVSEWYGGGGGGGGSAADSPRRPGGAGGKGGGGNGGQGATFGGVDGGHGGAGGANTGGGGGGAGSTGDRSNPDYNWNLPNYPGGPGGSGRVIVAYRIG
jgi:hypothetical protein